MPPPLPIFMYVSPDCEDSQMAHFRLLQLEIPFAEINIEEDEAGAQYVEQINNGLRSTPTIVFGDEIFIVVEPSWKELDGALKRAGYDV